MKNFIVLSLLVSAALCAPQKSEKPETALENENETSTDLAIENEIVLEEEEDSAPVIIENFNDVNEDGSYTFGYKASDGTFKKETRDLEGNVKGMYGYLDDNGEVQVVEYASNNSTGFKILSGNQAPVAPEVPALPQPVAPQPQSQQPRRPQPQQIQLSQQQLAAFEAQQQPQLSQEQLLRLQAQQQLAQQQPRQQQQFAPQQQQQQLSQEQILQLQQQQQFQQQQPRKQQLTQEQILQLQAQQRQQQQFQQQPQQQLTQEQIRQLQAQQQFRQQQQQPQQLTEEQLLQLQAQQQFQQFANSQQQQQFNAQGQQIDPRLIQGPPQQQQQQQQPIQPQQPALPKLELSSEQREFLRRQEIQVSGIKNQLSAARNAGANLQDFTLPSPLQQPQLPQRAQAPLPQQQPQLPRPQAPLPQQQIDPRLLQRPQQPQSVNPNLQHVLQPQAQPGQIDTRLLQQANALIQQGQALIQQATGGQGLPQQQQFDPRLLQQQQRFQQQPRAFPPPRKETFNAAAFNPNAPIAAQFNE